jgi:transcriptional regulator with XRE-family HTH domain
MIRWDVAERAARKGWTRPAHLAHATGVSEPAAKRILSGAKVDKIDVPTLLAIHAALGLRGSPWSLLSYVPRAPR